MERSLGVPNRRIISDVDSDEAEAEAEAEAPRASSVTSDHDSDSDSKADWGYSSQSARRASFVPSHPASERSCTTRKSPEDNLEERAVRKPRDRTLRGRSWAWSRG
jgi:hypothetical protein